MRQPDLTIEAGRVIVEDAGRLNNRLDPIYIQRSVGGLTFPMAYASSAVGGNPRFLTVSAGLIDFNGTAENANVGIRIYEPLNGQDGWLNANYLLPSSLRVIHTMVGNRCDHVPWGRDLSFLLEVFLVGGLAVPATASTVEISVFPWSP